MLKAPLLAAVLIVSSLTACATLLGEARPVTVSTGDAAEAARLISAYRVSRGLGPVVVDEKLHGPAIEQARAVAQAGRLTHGDFAGRMAGYDVAAASENLAMGSPTLPGTIAQWRQSRPHDANLLKPGMTRIGFARAETIGKGRNTYWALVLAR